MDLWRLKIFKHVVDQKSFTKASETVHISQPTISSHIKDLETHFNCKLLDRLDKHVLPTKAGELLYQYTSRLLALYDETEAAMAAFHGKIKGRLVIGGSTIPAGYILPQIIGKFIKKYPDVTISLVAGDTEAILEDILSGILEAGIVGAKSQDKMLSQKKVIDEEMRVIVPKGHKWFKNNNIDIKALLNEPFIIREKGSGTLKSIRQSLGRKGLKDKGLNVVAELGSTEAVIQGIKNRIGVSILSPIAVADEIRTNTLNSLKVKGLDLTRKFYLVRHKHRSMSPICRAFTKFIESYDHESKK